MSHLRINLKTISVKFGPDLVQFDQQYLTALTSHGYFDTSGMSRGDMSQN